MRLKLRLHNQNVSESTKNETPKKWQISLQAAKKVYFLANNGSFYLIEVWAGCALRV